MSHAETVATKLAEALDRRDYEAARACLAEECHYEIRGETISGADAILASYQSNDGSDSDRFDSVEFTSSVSPIDDSQARIEYTDVVTIFGENHTHRCDQLITLDPSSGKISHIEHVDLPGETEALKQFEEQHRRTD